MKILIIRNYPSYMDVKHNTYNIQEVGLAKALVRKGHHCDIVFWTDKQEKEEKVLVDNKVITVFYRRSKVVLKNAIYKNLDELIEKYDVVQPAEYNQLQSWLLAKKYPNKTVIFHGPYYSSFNKRYNAMCKLMDMVILPAYKKLNTRFLVKSNLAKEFLVAKGIQEKNITVVGVGIDLDALSVKESKIPEENAEFPKELLKINNYKDKLRLLYIGRLEPRRNIPFLFDILKKLIEVGVDTELIMIGNGDTEYCSKSLEYAHKLGVKDSIYWVKKAEQKYLSYAYRNSDIFLLPTHYEIFGMVLLEAMYFGKPVITTKNGGSEVLIENGQDGVIIDNFDAEKWCGKIIEMRNNYSIGKKASKKIHEKFTWNALADGFLEVYSQRR